MRAPPGAGRTRGAPTQALCRGPGNLTRALGITLAQNRLDLVRVDLRIEDRGLVAGRVDVGAAHRHPRRHRPPVALLGRRPSGGVGDAPPPEHRPTDAPSARSGIWSGSAGTADWDPGSGFALSAPCYDSVRFYRPWEKRCCRRSGTSTPSACCRPGRRSCSSACTSIHEVTTPQAFDALRERGWKVARPDRTFATVDHIVPDAAAHAAVSRRARRGHDLGARANCRDFGVPLVRPGRRPPGHRPRDRTRARADAAGDDHRLRRQPHLDAWRVRLGGVRHRHLAGARRARVAVPGDGAAQGAPHPRQRHAAGRASTPRTSSSPSSSGSASAAASATPTSTPATPSSACRWTSG